MRVLNLVTSSNAAFYQQQCVALRRRGVAETTLAVPGERRPAADGMRTRSVLDYVRFSVAALRRAGGDYDLVHANYGLTAPPAIAQSNLPVVVSLWGSDLLGAYGRLTRWCARRADAVVVMTPAMADELDVDCHVLPHGVDVAQFRPFPRRPAREAVGWRHDALHVLFPYPPEKRVKDYPRAQRIVAAAGERLDGRVAGDVLLQTLHGVPHAEMPLYVNAADALLLTSKREGSPNAVKEAMACNLPVVATDVGDVRSRIADVEPSHVCTTDAELVDGLVDVLERGEPSNGREAIRSLAVDEVARRLHEVYADVLGRPTETTPAGRSAELPARTD